MPIFLLLTTTGAAAGAAAHSVLSRLDMSFRRHRTWCVLGVMTLWTPPIWRTAAGGLPLWWLPIPLLAGWLAVTLTVVDLRHRRLPDALTLPAYPAAAAAVALVTTQTGWHIAETAALGAVTLGTAYALIHTVAPSAMGAGDVKLSGSQGALLGAAGWPAVVVGAVLAALLTLLLNAVAPRSVRTRWRTGIPHGPALLMSTYLLVTFSTVHTPP